METPDLRQLRYFVAVAEELNFTRAAERLGMAQPPLTLQIQKLERMLGCQLLVRGRRTRLTEAGARLAEEARRVLDQAERAVLLTQRVASGDEGELRVGVPPSVMLTGLAEAIRRFRGGYSRVTFTLREMATSAIEQALRSGEIDVGFLRETRLGAPLQSEVFLTEPLVAVLPARHALAKAAALKLRSLRQEPFVFFPRRVGPAFYDAMLADCGHAGFAPRIVQEATQWQTVVAFVEAGMGVSLAPASVEKFRWPGVVFRRLPDVETRVFVSWRPEAPGAAVNFLRYVRRVAVLGRAPRPR